MNQDQLEQRFAELHKLSEEYAEAAGVREHITEYRKVKKADLMKQAETDGIESAAKQEREAYAHQDYKDVVEALKEAVTQEVKLKWKLRLFETQFEAWRTMQATKRAEMNLR